MSRPLIGITPTPSSDAFPHGTFYRFTLADTYVHAVRRSGAVPVILPAEEDVAQELVERLDGLIFSGGGDVAPALYTDDDPHPRTGQIDDLRDAFEIALMRDARRRDLPTLAICRGIQVMNVAFGGSLIQHVADAVGETIPHRQHEAGYTRDDLSHGVTIAAGPNPLRDVLQIERFEVNSFHHQAIDRLAVDLRVCATADDGIVEAVHHPGMTFGLGVQWHPEMLDARHPLHASLFGAFAAAARTTTPANI